MKFILLLADAAQIDEKAKIHALGLGWGHTVTPTPPMAIVAFVELQPEQLPTDYSIGFELLDANHDAAKVPLSADGDVGPFAVTGTGIASKPPPEDKWRQEEPVRVPTAVTIGPMPLAEGVYYFRGTFTLPTGESATELVRFRVRPPNKPQSSTDEAQASTDQAR